MRCKYLIGLLACVVLAAMNLRGQTLAAPSPGASHKRQQNPRKAKEAFHRGLQAEQKQNWPLAFAEYTDAVRWLPTNREYLLRREIVRGQIVQQDIDRAEREVLSSNFSKARQELREALALDPGDEIARERLAQLAPGPREAIEKLLSRPAGPARLKPLPGTRRFDYRGDTEGAYEEVARDFGVDASFDEDLVSRPVHLKISGVDFATAMRVLGDTTGTFWRPLTNRLFFVAADTPEKRREYDISVVRTVQLSESTTPQDLTEIFRTLREITGVTRAELDIPSRTITLRASPQAMAVATELIQQLEQPRGELVLEMEVLEVDRTAARQLGITPPESASAFTLSQQQIQEAQQSVQGLASVLEQLFGSSGSFSGLGTSQIASLVGSGQLGLGALIPPLVAFGGGRTTFLATLPGAAASFSNVLSLVRSGQRILLRAEDGKPVTFFVGDRVPITLGLFAPSLTPSQFVPGVTPATFPESTFATGASPVSIVAADFNGDGILDLAVADHTANTVSILLGNGDGTFGTATSFPTGNGPIAIATGDFNEDGHTDLAVVNQADNTVSILLGNGDGTFEPKTDFPTGKNPVAIASGDFNGDGHTDLAVVNQADNTVSILLGNGDGTFRPKTDFPTGDGPSAITTADFNGDGRIDLAVTNQLANTVSILLGNGDGTFSPKTDFPTGNSPAGILAADFNADGRTDLAIANQVDNTVSILLGNGDGTFGPKTDFATGAGPVALATADFNIDGRPDLAVADQNANTVSILIGNGDGTFAPRLDLQVGTQPTALVAADFNGDNRTDLAVANQSANTVSVILNTASFVSPQGTTPLTPFPNSEYIDIGLKVKATPRMHPDGDVTLDLHFELRSLTGDTINGIPVISNRTIDQVVRVRENETTALAGFIQSQEMRAINGTPGLADLGAAGLLAGNRNTQQNNSELLLLVTPRIVRLGPVPGRPIYAGRGPIGGGTGISPLPVRPVPRP